jgi:hypothetical protein
VFAFHRRLKARKDGVEVRFEQMFEQTSGNRISEILMRMRTPPQSKLPDFLWICLDVLCDFDNGLPPRIAIQATGRLSGQDRICFANRLSHRRASQRPYVLTAQVPTFLTPNTRT